MSDRLQGAELARIIEDDASQRLATYLAFENDLRPSLRNGAQALFEQDRVPDRVRIDGVNASFGE
jgi:hypothetical protein